MGVFFHKNVPLTPLFHAFICPMTRYLFSLPISTLSPLISPNQFDLELTYLADLDLIVCGGVLQPVLLLPPVLVWQNVVEPVEVGLSEDKV